jgi:hypothetical protein
MTDNATAWAMQAEDSAIATDDSSSGNRGASDEYETEGAEGFAVNRWVSDAMAPGGRVKGRLRDGEL